MTAGLPYVVWMAPTSWDGIPGTDRPLAMALTRYARVLWVDPPLSPVSPARLRGEVSGGLVPALTDIDERITRLTPVALPGLTRPGIRGTTAPLVRAQVRWALRKRGIRPFAVVAGYLEDLLGRWGDAVNVIYSTDDHVAGAELMGLSADRVRAQERLAAATCERGGRGLAAPGRPLGRAGQRPARGDPERQLPGLYGRGLARGRGQ